MPNIGFLLRKCSPTLLSFTSSVIGFSTPFIFNVPVNVPLPRMDWFTSVLWKVISGKFSASNQSAPTNFLSQTSTPLSTEAVLIILGDQPAVTTSDLKLLVDNFYLAHKTRVTGSKQQVILAVAGIYGNPPTPGVPAVFDKQLFIKLCSLKGDQGAKPILNKLLEQQSLLCVEMPNAAVDIDTQEDLKNYCQ